MSKGIDCAVSIASRAHDLVKLGYTFACRYYFPGSKWRVELSREEAEACKRAGLWLVSVYEGNPTEERYFTGHQAQTDANIAYMHAKAIGQPKGTTIYFAYDTDVHPDIAEVYGQALHDTLGRRLGHYYEPAAYGSGAVIERLKSRGYIKRGWLAQSKGWRGFDHANGHQELQQGRETTLLGLDVDTDVSNGNGGGWMLP